MSVRKRTWTTAKGEKKRRGSSITSTSRAIAISRPSSARRMLTPPRSRPESTCALACIRPHQSRSS